MSWPLAMVLVRLPLILLGQAFAFFFFQAQGADRPWETAQSWTYAYFPVVVDLPCLLLLSWLLAREGRTLGDVLAQKRDQMGKDIGLGLLLGVVLLVPFLAITFVANMLVLGPGNLAAGGVSAPSAQSLPAWARWWTVLVLPISASIVEEMTYRGYALPRIMTVAGALPAVLVVSLGYGLQHVALPLIDAPTSAARFLSTALQGAIYALLYLRLRRLAPLIVVHWAHNAAGLALSNLSVAP